MTTIEGQDYYSIEDIAERAMITKGSVRTLYKKWGLTPYYYGKRVFFKPEEVDALFAKRMKSSFKNDKEVAA